jgi:hypothetical protein
MRGLPAGNALEVDERGAGDQIILIVDPNCVVYSTAGGAAVGPVAGPIQTVLMFTN